MVSLNQKLAAAVSVLCASDPETKCINALMTRRLAANQPDSGRSRREISIPDRPARPLKPALVPPVDVPRRRMSTAPGRFALLHAVAHIEFNAIDLAFDMAARFASEIDKLGLDYHGFIDDWFSVGQDEARHFKMISDRLGDLGGAYGDLPAHDGLWDAALDTRDGVLARLAVAPMVLEARGLDVTPGMIEKLTAAGDALSADILATIYKEEVAHVALGVKWFNLICAKRQLIPETVFKDLVKQSFKGKLKPPFNHEARTAAGLPEAFYQ